MKDFLFFKYLCQSNFWSILYFVIINISKISIFPNILYSDFFFSLFFLLNLNHHYSARKHVIHLLGYRPIYYIRVILTNDLNLKIILD